MASGLACLALCGGCALREGGWPGIFEGRREPVAISNLDWVEIRFLPHPSDPLFDSVCRLSLYGSGEIEFRTGRSPRVEDAFSTAVDDPDWNDLRTDRQHVGQERMQALYQELVDAGLFPRRGAGPPPRRSVPLVRVNARIGRERVLRLTDDRRIVALVERILASFAEGASAAPRREEAR